MIQKFLTMEAMIYCNLVSTPAYTTTLGLDTNSALFNESWKYSTVLGVTMYLTSNSRPDIDFSVHQCVCFIHVPHLSHAKAVKCIFRYIKGIEDKGLILEPSHKLQVYCYIGA